MTKYAAGWNMPGYLPEDDPETFDSFSDAVNYLIEIVDLLWNDDLEAVGELPDVRAVIDARWKDLYDALKKAATDPNDISFAGYTGDGWYAFWVAPEFDQEGAR